MAPLVWLVTGCSSGFGVSFVESIIAKGDKVIATSRGDVSIRLAALKELGAAILELDVTSPQAVLNDKTKEAVKIFGRIDVLVNNAGYVDGGIIEEIDQQILLDNLMANALGPINLTRAVLPYMRQQQSGTIIINGSMTAYFGAPGAGPYCAGKGLLEALTNTLQMEVAPWNIRCCLLVPGMFRTDVFKSGNTKLRSPNKIPEYEEMRKGFEGFVTASDQTQQGDPRKATDIVVDAVHGDGIAAGKKLPLRLPLGADAMKVVREDCLAKMALWDEWDAIASSTDFSA